MTRKEAIKILKEIEYPVNGDNKEYRDIAFDMAIKALEQEPILNKIRTEIESREDKICSSRDYNKAEYVAYTDAITDVLVILDKYKTED